MDIIEMINNNNIQGFIDNVAQCMGRIAEIEKALLCNRSFPIFIKLSFIKNNDWVGKNKFYDDLMDDLAQFTTKYSYPDLIFLAKKYPSDKSYYLIKALQQVTRENSAKFLGHLWENGLGIEALDEAIQQNIAEHSARARAALYLGRKNSFINNFGLACSIIESDLPIQEQIEQLAILYAKAKNNKTVTDENRAMILISLHLTNLADNHLNDLSESELEIIKRITSEPLTYDEMESDSTLNEEQLEENPHGIAIVFTRPTKEKRAIS